VARAVKFNFGGNILESEIIKVDRTGNDQGGLFIEELK
jgi:hypothetical protein